MKAPKIVGVLLATSFFGTAVAAEPVTLTIESWRNDDLTIWQDKIIPAFEANHPDIKVIFAPTAPAQYNSALNAKLEAGTAGDLITCRPFDGSLKMFEAGHLADLSDMDALKNFGPVAKSGWSTDDGSATFCIPMASVIHGFIYNKDAFKEIGVEEPKTVDEFYAMLDKIKADGNYIPMSMGTADEWEAATMGYANIGTKYWKGEEGRLALIAGKSKLTDKEWVEPYAELSRWGQYLGDGFEAQTYPDSQNLFTLGRAAIYPAGSWEISGFNAQADFEMGAFPPPVLEGGDCYISDHVDIAIGMNPATKNPEAVKTFLDWAGSAEFASLYANALPGFFSLSNHDVTLEDPLAQTMVDWRKTCNSSIRPYAQILGRGTPNLHTEYWVTSANVIRGTMTPEEAGQHMQDALDSWYKPPAQ
ncbi:MAG TPA: carbohydrate ABC transporter substrate-binding protein [Rhodobacteraceae bacterium]|nr:carbohydrate ABC transporter substrate-binding protein [Paracoccaceae bacterium]